MFKLPYVICIIWESSVKCKVLFKRDCIYQCRISARNQLCFIPVLPQIQIRLTLCERIVVFLRNLSTLQLLALQISRSGSSKSIFHGLLMIPWFHYRFCLRENDQVQNSQLRIFYLQGSIYVPKIKVKQLLCGLGNLNWLLNEGSSPHPTTLESAFTSQRKSRSNFQARSKACLVPVSCDTSTLHPSKCKWYVGSHRCGGRWQAPPVSLAPSLKVRKHKWWNATNHCLQGHFSSIFLTLRVPEMTELEISKNCSPIFLLRSSASLVSLFSYFEGTQNCVGPEWQAQSSKIITFLDDFPKALLRIISDLKDHQTPKASVNCAWKISPKKIKTSHRDDINFEDTTMTWCSMYHRKLLGSSKSSKSTARGTGIPHMQGKSDDASCGIAASDLSIRNRCGMWGRNRYGCGNVMEMDTTYRCTYKSKHIVSGV